MLSPRSGRVGWSLWSLVLSLLLVIPMVTLIASLGLPASENWSHIRSTVLPEYVQTSLLLAVGVAVGASVLGVGCAWITATMRFPGAGVLTPALVLPLAAPAYVIAYVYTDFLDFAGPVQSLLRDSFGWSGGDYYFPPLRSLGGAMLVLTLVLYPYVYLLARAAFINQSGALFDAARSLGQPPGRAFFSVALPTARPAIAGGVALVVMETLADYGVVEYFGLATFTTGIFRTWYALGDRTAALQLAGYLFLVILVLVFLEAALRRGRVANPLGRAPQPRLTLLSGWRGWAAATLCALPVGLGFLLPLVLLILHAVQIGDPQLGINFINYVTNSFQVAGLAAFIATAIALFLSYSLRLAPGRRTRIPVQVAALGYALPGAVLGLAVLLPLSELDKWLAGLWRDFTGERPSLLLTGSIAALVFAYVVRFLTAAYNACQGGFAQIAPQLDAVGHSLGASPRRMLAQVHFPLIRPAVLTAILLVFIDVLKELPATLILRPFNFETLATRVYRLASDERIAEASTAALMIVLLGLLPTVLLMRRSQHGQADLN